MAYDAHVLKVLIASPSDTASERDAVERALHGWNAARSEREQVILLPRRWETNAVPRLGPTGQGVINAQLVDDADIVVALFDSRLGMATEAAVSGTAEEIQRSHTAGKPVHVWFSDEPLPRDTDPDQLRALRDFKAALQSMGLLGSYASPDDLAFQVREAIESDLNHLDLGAVKKRMPTAEHAVLRARYETDREPHTDSRGKVTYRNRNQRVTVRNSGSVSAECVRIKIQALQEGSTPPDLWHRDEASPTLIPESEFSWPLMTYMGTDRAFVIEMTWQEGSEVFTETQHVSS
jgi:hypothetical protein